MSNSNGMYNVLNIFKKLQPTQEQSVKAEAQAIYESVEAKGSIVEGVKSVEQKLREQFDKSKKAKKDYDKDGEIESEKDEVIGSRRKAAGLDEASDKADKDYDKDGEIESEKDEVIGSRRKAAGLDEEQVDEMFSFATKPSKDRGPRDTGRGDELARREKSLGKGGLGKGKPFGNEYKQKGKYGNQYGIAGPKGVLPEEREENPTIKGTEKKAKSVYNPVNKPGQVKRLDKPTNKYDNVKNEVAPPGKKAEKMVKSIKAGYANDGKLTDKEKGIAYATAWKAHNAGKVEESRKRKIAEGINFAEMMKETDSGIAEMLSEIQADINAFKKTGHCSDKLEAFLKVHNHGKKLMGETVPKGPSFAPQDAMALAKPTAPFEPSRIQGTKPSILDRAKGVVGSVAGGINKAIGHGSDDELLSDLRNKSTFEDVELNELARLAGLTVSEGIELGDMADEMESHEGKITVNTNSSSDGNKSINISADGAAADQLMQMLKLAGMNSAEQPEQSTDSFGSCGDDEGAIAIDIGGYEEVDEAEAQYANAPEENYQSQEVITHQGTDMNREKKQFKKEYPGDNPMAVQALEAVDPKASFGRDLMAEYQALKLRK